MPVRHDKHDKSALPAYPMDFVHGPEQVPYMLYDILPIHFLKIITWKWPGILVKIVNDINAFDLFLIQIDIAFFGICPASQVQFLESFHQITTSGKVSVSLGSNGLSMYIRTINMPSLTFLNPCAVHGVIFINLRSSSLKVTSCVSPVFMSFSTRCILPCITQYHSFIF